MDLALLQVKVHEAKEKYRIQKHRDSSLALLKILEELGELSEAHYRLIENGGEYDPEELEYKLRDSIGDVVISITGYCQLREISIDACVNQAFQEILHRWEKGRRFGDIAYKDKPNERKEENSKPEGSVDGKLCGRNRGESSFNSTEEFRRYRTSDSGKENSGTFEVFRPEKD